MSLWVSNDFFSVSFLKKNHFKPVQISFPHLVSAFRRSKTSWVFESHFLGNPWFWDSCDSKSRWVAESQIKHPERKFWRPASRFSKSYFTFTPQTRILSPWIPSVLVPRCPRLLMGDALLESTVLFAKKSKLNCDGGKWKIGKTFENSCVLGLSGGPLCRTLFKEQNQVPEPGDLEVLPARVTDFGPRKGILRMKCETEFQNFHSGEILKSRLLTLLSVLPLNNVVHLRSCTFDFLRKKSRKPFSSKKSIDFWKKPDYF